MSNNQLPADVQERIKADAEAYANSSDALDPTPHEISVWKECYTHGATAEAVHIDEAIDKALHDERNKMQAKFSEADKQWAALLKQREDKAQVLADALENAKTHIHDLCMTIIRLGYTPYNPISEINEALQQWKEGKEPQVELSCMVCGTKFMGPEPKMCCSGRDCGCMGLPIDPIVCSEECYNNLPAKKQTPGKEVGQAEAKEGLVRLILAGAAEVSKDGESAKQYLAKEGVDVKKVMEDGRYIQWKEGKEVGNG